MATKTEFSIDSIDYMIEIENPNAEVSKGGELKFKVTGPNKTTNSSLYNLYFDLNENSFMDKQSTQQVHWSYHENLSHPRYAKITIKDEITGRFPKRVKLRVYSDDRKTKRIAETEFKIERDGNKGHNPYKGKYVHDIIADKANKDGKHTWYRVSCMSSPDGTCNINIKDGEHDKYNGQKPRIAHHSVSDRNYPGASTLRVGDPVIFDARKLIVENNETPNPPAGYEVEMNAVCRFSSDHPIMIEPIDSAHVGVKI
ncbi:MAG: hypothetical protein ISN29_10760 [Gammaproteobacteria bacterium AqS3]|nr:hypothetical protein [Gammaproteobacteria bacterium AqS3]